MYQVNRKESVCFRSSAFRFFYIFSAGRGGGGHAPAYCRIRQFTLIELLVVIAIIAIVVASKVGFFLQFSAIFAFKAL